jgi:hypothetical protein
VNQRQIEMDGQTYVCRVEDDSLQIGRLTGADVQWLETVPTDAADDDEALRGVITALVNRGG